MTFFLMLGVSVAAYYMALVSVGSKCNAAETFEQFIRSVIAMVIVGVVVTVIVYFLFTESASLMLTYMTTYFVTMLTIDYESTFDGWEEEDL